VKRPTWIKAGSYVINAELVFWINTEAKWMGEPEGGAPKDAWGEIPPVLQVERTGVEVILMTYESKTLRFVDGSPAADDLKRFAESQTTKQ
jgi:hypothetical protein